MELHDYLRILRMHWIGIAALVVLGTVAALGITVLQPRVYTATATGYVSTPAADAATSNTAAANAALAAAQLAQSQVNSFVTIGTWRPVAEYAIHKLDLAATPEALVQQVTVTNPLNTLVIQVDANSGTPQAAHNLAEAWIQGMQQQIVKLQTTGNKGNAATVMLIPGESAQLPTSPSSPDVKLYLALGAVLGLVLGLGYAVTRQVLDRRVRDPREIQRQTGAAVMAAIPVAKEVGESRLLFGFDAERRETPATEAMRKLRTNLQYTSIDDPPRVIVVTSPLPGDGKSFVAANLAMGFAAAGQRVILIDGDLRRPVVASIFGLKDDAGLTDLLARRATIPDIAHMPDPEGHLAVFTAGPTPPDPSELLGSKRMRELLEELSEEAMVIIDTPPTIPVTDAAALASAADGVLLVASAGRTTYDMLHAALDSIHAAKGHVLGVVLNKVPQRGAGSTYYYGYQYTSGYSSTKPEKDRRPAREATPTP
jgi:capsular exopolysaccharide synthesis family protein